MADEFGAVKVFANHVGGMSPGCATTLTTSADQMIFIKAVGPQLNPHTPTLFRNEIGVLRRLGPVAYRPKFLAAFDDGEWVALVLEHIPGRYPDLASQDDFAAVARAVDTQIAELTPAPSGVDVASLAATARRWGERWSEVREAPRQFLPGWAADRADELASRVAILPSQLSTTSLCHFDVRDDNLLIRENGDAVILDWGMARLGPAWTDQVLLAVQKATAHEAQFWLDRWVPDGAQDTVTSMLVAFGGSQAWNARQPSKPGLPAFVPFARDDAQRLLAISRLRLPA